MTDSSPASGRKKRGVGAMKEKYEARIAELQEQLARSEMRDATGPMPAPAPVAEGTYDPSRDPLAWISKENDVWEVPLVGRVHSVRGRRSYDDKRGRQDKTFLSAERTNEWISCPFDFSSKNPQEDRELKWQNRKWWHFTVTREFAESVYSGFDPLHTEAIVDPADFDEVDDFGRPKGRRSPCSDDPLREYVRWVLQTNPNTMFICVDGSNLSSKGWVRPEKPNPYGAGVHVDKGPTSPRMAAGS